jgi:hypothetical protein
MKIWFVPMAIGITLALVAVYQLHAFMLLDTCLDFGGTYQKTTDTCIDSTGQQQIMVASGAMLLIYGILGVVVAGISAFAARKVLAAWWGAKHAETYKRVYPTRKS